MFETIRQNFPLLQRLVHDKPLVYFDNAATTQKPKQVIEAEREFYEQHNANVHRGVHTLSDEATDLYEGARQTFAKFIHAEVNECIFTRNATEAINLVCASFADIELQAGDEILLSEMEHHANIVPWQRIAEKKGAIIKVIPVTEEGELNLEAFHTLLTKRVKFVAVTAISNVLGTINPIELICQKARDNGSYILIDAAQALAHIPLNVKALDCDFLVVSAHKAFGPTGIGALYGKAAHLEKMPPYQSGGEMIRWVSFLKTDYADPPHKFEAGTPNIAGAVGFKAALDYLSQLNLKTTLDYEKKLIATFNEGAKNIKGFKMIGNAEDKIAIFSFIIDNVHANDLGILLDLEGIAIRTGHHCAMPLIERFGFNSTARASLAVYNTVDEINYFFETLEKTLKMVQ